MIWDGKERRKSDPRHEENSRRLDEIKESLSVLIETMNGNGRPGVLTRIGLLESSTEGIQTSLVNHFRDDSDNFKVLFKHLYLGMGGLAVIMVAMRVIFN